MLHDVETILGRFLGCLGDHIVERVRPVVAEEVRKALAEAEGDRFLDAHDLAGLRACRRRGNPRRAPSLAQGRGDGDAQPAPPRCSDTPVDPGRGAAMTAATWDWLPTDETPIAEAALRYAEHGWRVFPCYAVVDGRCTCRKADCDRPGKHPATEHGIDDASSDPAVVRQWDWRDRNIGLPMGNGLFALDVDGPEGAANLVRLEAEHGPLPETLGSQTGKGEHRILGRPDDMKITNRVRVAPELDVRSDRGHIIVPPSLHLSGVRYRWVNRVAPAPAPAWLIDILKRPKKPPNGVPPSTAPSERPKRRGNGAPPSPAPGERPRKRGDSSPHSKAPGRRAAAWAGSALDSIVAEVSSASEGTRNDVLNSRAFRVGQLIGGGLLDQSAATDALHRAGLECGLTAPEVEKVLRPLGALDLGMTFPDYGPKDSGAPPQSDRGGVSAGDSPEDSGGAIPPPRRGWSPSYGPISSCETSTAWSMPTSTRSPIES